MWSIVRYNISPLESVVVNFFLYNLLSPADKHWAQLKATLQNSTLPLREGKDKKPVLMILLYL